MQTLAFLSNTSVHLRRGVEQGQHFAVVFVPSPDRVEKEWARHRQKQQQQQRRRNQLLESDKRDHANDRTESEENTGLLPSVSSGSSSTTSSASRTEESTSTGERGGISDAGSEGNQTDAAETAGGDAGCSTAGKSPGNETDAPCEAPTDQAVEVAAGQGESFGPAIEGCASGNHCSSEREDEAEVTPTKHLGEDCDSCEEADKRNGGARSKTKQGSLSDLPFLDELLDNSETESSLGSDDGNSSRWRKDRYNSTGGRSESSSSGATDGDGGRVGSEKLERREALSWVVSRVGLLEKVSPTYGYPCCCPVSRIRPCTRLMLPLRRS